jgi:hypothetical protein
MARSPNVTLFRCYAHGEKCVQKLDSHNVWKERWEGGEMRNGRSNIRPHVWLF